MQEHKSSNIIGFTITCLLAITFLVVGCINVEGPPVGPGEGGSPEAQEFGTTLGRIGLKVDPYSGSISQTSSHVGDKGGRLRLLPEIVNHHIDLVAATCPNCGSCTGPQELDIVANLKVNSSSPVLDSLSIVNETTSAKSVTPASLGPTGPLFPNDPLTAIVKVQLANCNEFNVFFDLQGEILTAGLTLHSIAAGGEHTIVLKGDGTVWTWGSSSTGQLGNGTVGHFRNISTTPVQVCDEGETASCSTFLSDVISIAAGGQHNLALKSDGRVWAWGRNSEGQLGDGTTTQRNTPVQVSGLNDVVAIAGGGSHTIALKSDGTVWTWGRNNSGGQLGDGTTTQRNTPVQVCDSGAIPSCSSLNQNVLSNVVAIAAGGSHSIALKSDGTVWTWGFNAVGQLGVGPGIHLIPIQVSAVTDVVAIAGGNEHTIVLKSDGTVFTWGRNFDGQLGIGTFSSGFSTPVQVSGLTDVVAIAGGAWHNIVLKNDGTVFTWGRNFEGQLGDGTHNYSPAPVQVIGLANVAAIAGGGFHTITQKSDGAVHTWGKNFFGQLGDGIAGINSKSTTPIQVCDEGETAPCSTFLSDVKAIAGGSRHTIALKIDGVSSINSTVFTWGDNVLGQLGTGTAKPLLPGSLTPVQVVGVGGGSFLTDVIAVTGGGVHTLALKSDETVNGWGWNNEGQLGIGTFSAANLTPVQVSGLTNVKAIAGGSRHTIALKIDGVSSLDSTVFTWGDNSRGQLGDGTTTKSSTPAQVSGLTDVVAIAGGDNHTIALKNDGTVWTWGSNFAGQLGDGTAIDRLTPVQVVDPGGIGLLTDIVAIAGGWAHTIALKGDGTVFTWGRNLEGQLGIGASPNASTTPVQVSGLTDVIKIAGGSLHTIALKSDGTVWTWGSNFDGQLGDGTTTERTTPVQVSGLTDVVAIASRGVHTITLIDTDGDGKGTVWTWGANFDGQLGDGTTANSSTPSEVNGL